MKKSLKIGLWVTGALVVLLFLYSFASRPLFFRYHEDPHYDGESMELAKLLLLTDDYFSGSVSCFMPKTNCIEALATDIYHIKSRFQRQAMGRAHMNLVYSGEHYSDAYLEDWCLFLKYELDNTDRYNYHSEGEYEVDYKNYFINFEEFYGELKDRDGNDIKDVKEIRAPQERWIDELETPWKHERDIYLQEEEEKALRLIEEKKKGEND